MTLEAAIELFNKLEQEKDVQNIFAQANARHILLEVKETDFPKFRENLNFGSNSLAFSYLSIGCCMFANNYQEIKDGKEIRRLAIEKGAEFIEYTHFHEQNRVQLSLYYLLIGALAYYASSQYSKAFILMSKVNNLYQSDVSILTSAFLKKDFKTVLNILSKILSDEKKYITENVEESEQTIDHHIQVVLYARAFANLINFLFFGDETSLRKTKEVLADLLELLVIEREPSMWWVVRLLIIIVNGLEESALWTTIPPYIPDNNTKLTTKFIKNLIFSQNPIVELFVVQRKALNKVLSSKGAVISLPTSSGKTRIAELAILKCLSENPYAKILYLAPFRSLCYEVEGSLNNTFEKIGFIVSQLYGSSQVSQIDRFIIEESNIFVATPEKAKVILRANDDIRNQIKLVIIDEGHLLDTNERQVRNEMFVEELKKYVKDNSGKIILLSAVLPNPNEIAEWIAQDSTAFINENERVARQRLGLLNFRSNKVSLEWQGEEKSFNPNFIVPSRPRYSRKDKPSSLGEAVALAALKLSGEKPLLIFLANARSVFTYAEALLKGMEWNTQKIKHQWQDEETWQMFELLCEEENSEENQKILNYARYGILCHHGKLNIELRNIIEKLMRNDKPKIIVATMTLGQGVNLGISTIIFAGTNFYDSQTERWTDIPNNQFWNVAGRAGRAFVDSEGKILYATENIDDVNKALRYFRNEPNRVESGFLQYIPLIKDIASQCNMTFEFLLELISENNHNQIITKDGKRYEEEFQGFFDLTDDILLSISIKFGQNPEGIDDHFRQTLAYIQAKNNNALNQDDIISFLNARLKAIEKQTEGKDKKKIVVSGLPLASALKLDELWENITLLTKEYLNSEQMNDERINLLEKIEDIMKSMPSDVFRNIPYSDEQLNAVRTPWLNGEKVAEIEKSQQIISNYFAYSVSWLLGAIASSFRKMELNEEAIIFEELALCCELGLPDILSAKIYLSGIKSRREAVEISKLLNVDSSINISEIRNEMKKNIEDIKKGMNNQLTKRWIDIYENTFNTLRNTTNSEIEDNYRTAISALL